MTAASHTGWARTVGFPVHLRPDTADAQVAADTFTGLYHVPPLDSPRTVLDCGANIGLTAAHYKHLWPDAKIVAVEPDDGNRAVAALNFDGPVLGYAVSTHNGRAAFQRDGLASDAYRLSSELQGGDGVLCATLSHLIMLWLDGHCDFVKLDIEGEEANVLPDSAWAGRVGSVLVECHEQINGYTWQDAIQDLTVAGFTAVRHEAHPQAVWAVKEES